MRLTGAARRAAGGRPQAQSPPLMSGQQQDRAAGRLLIGNGVGHLRWQARGLCRMAAGHAGRAEQPGAVPGERHAAPLARRGERYLRLHPPPGGVS